MNEHIISSFVKYTATVFNLSSAAKFDNCEEVTQLGLPGLAGLHADTRSEGDTMAIWAMAEVAPSMNAKPRLEDVIQKRA